MPPESMALGHNLIILGLSSLLCACATAGQVHVNVGPPPSDLELSPFYEKHIDLDGFSIVASARVPDAALLAARNIIRRMIAHKPVLLQTLVRRRVRVAIMAESEKTTDIPEHSHLTPKAYWDKRARGLGATQRSLVCSCAEENLLDYPSDRYHGENILIHEFAHTLHEMAIVTLDETFDARLGKAYADAVGRGLWKDTYAATNHKEYWAEGVQSWFDANREAPAADGIHNEINTNQELRAYDPGLAALISEWFTLPLGEE